MAPSTPVDFSSARSDVESGYVSGSSSEDSLTEIYFTKPHLKFINKQLQNLEPQEILRWAIVTLPNLFQTTAFGLTGLVTIDMLSKLDLNESSPIELIFLDTLHHFSETLDLVARVQARYPQNKLHIYQPQDVESEQEFAAKYGANLWETDDERYDFLAKVEPAQRAYADLNVRAVLTGRRRSQGGKRGDLDIVEVDDAGLIKINPLANWSFKQVKSYIDAHQVPYNTLLDQGYKSVGDYHSTQPVKEGEDERSGRWAGKDKSECGIHNKRSVYAQYLEEIERQEREAQIAAALAAKGVAGGAEETEFSPLAKVESAVRDEQQSDYSSSSSSSLASLGSSAESPASSLSSSTTIVYAPRDSNEESQQKADGSSSLLSANFAPQSITA